MRTQKTTPHARHHKGKGPSSFWLHDSDQLFEALSLKPGQRFADLGCGPGDYALEALNYVGDSGKVFAFDKSSLAIEQFKQKIYKKNLRNIYAQQGDLKEKLPFADSSLDLCLISTVIHIFGLMALADNFCSEIKRVLANKGRLAIIECKKEDQPWGPPKEMRISHLETEDFFTSQGFSKVSLHDLGFTYLLQFEVKAI